MSLTNNLDNNIEANHRHDENELQKAEKKAVMWALGIVAGTTTFLLAIIIAFLTGWFTGVLIFGGIPAVLLTFAILHLHLQDNEQRRMALAQDRSVGVVEHNRSIPTTNTSSNPSRFFSISNDASLRQPQLQVCSYFQQTHHCQHCQHCHGGHVTAHTDGNVTDSLPVSCRESVPPPPAYDSLFPAVPRPSAPEDNKQ